MKVRAPESYSMIVGFLAQRDCVCVCLGEELELSIAIRCWSYLLYGYMRSTPRRIKGRMDRAGQRTSPHEGEETEEDKRRRRNRRRRGTHPHEGAGTAMTNP